MSYNAAAALGRGKELYVGAFVGELPFTYPPFAGTIFRVLTLVPFEVAASIWQALSGIVLLVEIIGVFRERGYSWSPGLVFVSIAAVARATLAGNDLYAPTFWQTQIFETNRIGEEKNPGAQSLGSVMYRLGNDSSALWLMSVIAIVALFSIAALGCYRRGNYSMIMALGGVTECIISPFSWYHHWVFVAPLFVVFLCAALGLIEVLSHRIGGAWGWILEQVFSLMSVAMLAIVFLPFVSNVSAPTLSFCAQNNVNDNPLLLGSFTFLGVAFVVLVAIYYMVMYFVDRRQMRSPKGSCRTDRI